eukprot:COSAG02_NODE_217_length_28595_cov_19.642371_36_plen_68_part_00
MVLTNLGFVWVRTRSAQPPAQITDPRCHHRHRRSEEVTKLCRAIRCNLEIMGEDLVSVTRRDRMINL